MMKPYKRLFEDELPNLQKEYVKYNKLLFDNTLPDIPLKWTTQKRIGGKAVAVGIKNKLETWEVKHIEISKFTDRSYEQFASVLIHEMAHVKFFVDGIIDVGGMHGLYFKEEVKRLNKELKQHGLDIVVTLDENIDQAKVASDIKSKPVLVVLVYRAGKPYGIQIFNVKALDDLIPTYKALPEGWWEQTQFTMKFVVSENKDLLKYPIKQKYTKGSFKTYPIDSAFFKQLEQDKLVGEIG